MTIQFNTGSNVNGTETMQERFTELIAGKLDRFSEQITRIEVHLNDVNGKKEGQDDKRCVLEARLEGLQPVAVTGNGDTYDSAVIGAIEKMKAALDTVIGKLRTH